MRDPSIDPLAAKETSGEQQYLIFGVKAISWQFYTHHYYADEIYYNVHYLPYTVVLNYIAGYYGIEPQSIENFKVDKANNKVTFTIADNP